MTYDEKGGKGSAEKQKVVRGAEDDIVAVEDWQSGRRRLAERRQKVSRVPAEDWQSSGRRLAEWRQKICREAAED